MEKEIMKVFITQGAYAILFVYLLFYVLKENAKRENRLMQYFEGDIKEIKGDIEDIKDSLLDIKGGKRQYD
ncbi:BhlA/UviB family holin-like peptide [Tissierella praeacuta]|uniref:BhlA/UviB family holin-like peptide n=1 Tax=Tissierella praeacuta TaxID=43131 RepID=UPI003DA66406